MDAPAHPAVVAEEDADIVSTSLLTSSENVNNENREKELRLTATTSSDATTIDSIAEEASTVADADSTEAEAVDSDSVAVSAAVDADPTAAADSAAAAAAAAAADVDAAPTPVAAEEPSGPSDQPDDEYTKHLRYNDQGVAIYTDPSNAEQFQFDDEKQEWIPATEENRIAADAAVAAPAADPYENEHYRWCHETQQWLAKQPTADSSTAGDAATTTETEFYKFDAALHLWIPKASTHQVTTTTNADGEPLHTYTDQDGAVFFWDSTKNAWFPQIDDDFMARYQMGYGNYQVSDEEEEDEVELLEKLLASKGAAVPETENKEEPVGEQKSTAKRKAPVEPPKWFDLAQEKNTKVYVSNLPTDITEPEFVELMSKYGMICRDPGSNKMKVKLYSDAEGNLKGDGLCDYIRLESVEMALKLLDGLEVRGCKVRVERAKFQMRGEYNPALKPKKKKKDKEKLKKMQEKLFDWRPEKMRGERSKHERTVIIKNLFTPELFEKEVQLIIDYQTNLREECTKCGKVRKVIVYDQHPDGVAQVNMSDPEEADLVVQMMNKRFFGQRQLVAELWDGKTKYKIEETAGEENRRLANWDQFLVTDEAAENNDNDTPTTTSPDETVAANPPSTV